MEKAAFRQEVKDDLRRANQVMAQAHEFFHGSVGWNKCEQEPCWSVHVLCGDVAILLMEDEPGAAA